MFESDRIIQLEAEIDQIKEELEDVESQKENLLMENDVLNGRVDGLEERAREAEAEAMRLRATLSPVVRVYKKYARKVALLPDWQLDNWPPAMREFWLAIGLAAAAQNEIQQQVRDERAVRLKAIEQAAGETPCDGCTWAREVWAAIKGGGK